MAKVGFKNGVETVLGLDVDPQSVSDSFVSYSQSGVQKWISGNYSSDDSYRISQGGALGTNDAFVITPSRAILKPAQPTFQAYNSAPVANVTGDATNFIITFDTIDYNIGGNGTTKGFIDPNYVLGEDGTYIFTASIVLNGLTNAHTSGQLYMKSSNGQTQYGARINPWAMSDGGNLAIEANGQFKGVAGDQIFLILQVSGGAKVVSVYGAPLTQEPSSFQGFLLG